MNEPTAAERERARAFTNRVKINDGDLAQLLAAVRAEHDVAAIMRDERWKPCWTLGYERGMTTSQFSVINLADYAVEAASGDDSLGFIVASGATAVQAIRAALETVKESP